MAKKPHRFYTQRGDLPQSPVFPLATTNPDPPLDPTPDPTVSDRETLTVDGPQISGAESAEAPGNTLRVGTLFGRYTLVEHLGAGGMGVVYSAYDPTLDRKVAIKLLAPNTTGATRPARLLREAQALARLAHPNVVSVHEVGSVDEQVFLAMELVEGQTLGAWLEDRPRSHREIFEIFLQAGRGLAAAHAADLVHRDFKPANLLIGKDGRARVVDFGLAQETRASDPSSASPRRGEVSVLQVPLTVTGARLGTPAYMAPEQLRGEATDARSDQFSFCVTLYESLLGVRPFDGQTHLELEAAIQQGLPQSTLGKLSRPLSRLLRRGLAYQPSERFSNMDALLAELATHLPGRRRWAVAAALTTGGLASLMIWQLIASRAELCGDAARHWEDVWGMPQRNAIQQAFLATGEPFAADAWQQVAARLDRFQNRWTAMAEDSCQATHRRGEQSEALLDLRMVCLTGKLADADALIHVLANADSALVRRAQLATKSLGELDVCADNEALLNRLPPPPDQVEKLAQLRESLAKVKALKAAGRYPEGIENAKALVEEARQLDYSPFHSEAIYWLGLLRELTSAYPQAVSHYIDAASLAETGRSDIVRAKALSRLALVEGIRLNKVEEAHRWAKLARALLGRMQSGDELRARLAHVQGNLASREGRFNDADELFLEALAGYRQSLGENHPDIASALHDLGIAHARAGNLDASEAYFTDSVGRKLIIYGTQHPMYAVSLQNLALLQLRQGHFADSQGTFEKALDIQTTTLAPSHRSLGLTLLIVAEHRLETGRPQQALEALAAAQQIFEGGPDPESREIVSTLLSLAWAHLDLGAPKTALPLIERVLELRPDMPEDPLEAARSRFFYARALLETGTDPARARELAIEARQQARKDPLFLAQRLVERITQWLDESWGSSSANKDS